MPEDRIRQLITGKNNASNITKIPDKMLYLLKARPGTGGES
jgi:hypothetical protein